MFKIRCVSPKTYHNTTATWYNVLQLSNNLVQRSTTWLQRSKNVTEREQNAYATLCYVSGTLWYVTIRCGTLCYVAAVGHNEAQRRTTWRQRLYSVAAARRNPTLIVTAGLHRGDSVASKWRQRGTSWHPAEMCKFISRTWRSETEHSGADKT